MSKIIVFALLVLFSISVSGITIKGNFRLNQAINNFGYIDGSFEYDWDRKAFILSFPTNGYTEYYQYNSDRGQKGNHKDQYTFQTSTSPLICGKCQRLANFATMPPLTTQPDGEWTANGTVSINGNTCNKFTFSNQTNSNYQVKHVYLSTSLLPCGFTFEDGRNVILTSIVPSSTTLVFDPPADCACKKRLDVAIHMDGSGSIDANEWSLMNDFVRNLLKEFTFGTDGAALAITQYWGVAELQFPFIDNLQTLQTQMQNDLKKSSVGGTNTVAAIEVYKRTLAPARRSGAIPVLITITDGADQSSPAVIQQHITDLQQNYGVKDFISVFIGQQTTTQAQMLALANGNPARALVYDDFAAFSQRAAEIQAAACASDIQQGGCGTGCCGYCMCGTCASPGGCDDDRRCTTESLRDTAISGLRCCGAPVSKPCNTTDFCKNAVCDENTGNCGEETKVCPPTDPPPSNSSCFNEICTPGVGCQLIDICDHTNCEDNNACTNGTYVVVGQNGACVFTPIPCEPANRCETALCDPVNGCVRTPINATLECDDLNPCTDDLCNPETGCYHINATCDDGNNCTVDQCRPDRGCYSDPVVCPTEGRCDIVSCLNGTCSSFSPTLCEEDIAGIGIGAGIIVAIVIGIVAGLALAGFGIYKGIEAYNAKDDLNAAGNNSAIYKDGGQYFNNKAYEEFKG